MFVFRSREIGHPFFAASAAFSNVALSASGTFAATSRCIEVTAHPASVLSNVAVAFVSTLSGVRPSFPSSPDRAMEKHPAWAAATSSSGFVPGSFSNRITKEYGVFLRAPLAVETMPLPSFSPPFHRALADRCMCDPPGRPKDGPLLTLRRPAVAGLVPAQAEPVRRVVDHEVRGLPPPLRLLDPLPKTRGGILSPLPDVSERKELALFVAEPVTEEPEVPPARATVLDEHVHGLLLPDLEVLHHDVLDGP